MMEALDHILRFAVIAVLLAIALRVLWLTGLTQLSVAMALFALSVSAYMLCSSRTLFALLGPVQYLAAVGCSNLSMFFWWFSRKLFNDGFHLRPLHGLLFVFYAALGQMLAFGPETAPQLAKFGGVVLHHVIALGLAFWAIFEAAKSRDTDLIESRRQLALIIVIGTGFYILMVLSVELMFRDVNAAPAWLETVNAAGILALSLILAPKFNRELFLAPANPARSEPDISPADRLTLQALLLAMEQENLFCEEALTITALAERLNVQEYRLRRLINQHLGYRNFNAFLNHYRIGAARAQLADITMARIPVLTIAMDLGYRSLSPFNRAFREITGVTPTEYRRSKLTENNLGDSEKIASIPESV
ncbi:MAG: helix-turn-helix domain-containing protein [Alphaproteobacteria bacterium]